MNKKSALSSFILVVIIIFITEFVIALFTDEQLNIGAVYLTTLTFWVYLFLRSFESNVPTVLLIAIVVVITIVFFRGEIIYMLRRGFRATFIPMLRILLQIFSFTVANGVAKSWFVIGGLLSLPD